MKARKDRHIELMTEVLEDMKKSRDQTLDLEEKIEWGKGIEKLSEVIEIIRKLP